MGAPRADKAIDKVGVSGHVATSLWRHEYYGVHVTCRAFVKLNAALVQYGMTSRYHAW